MNGYNDLPSLFLRIIYDALIFYSFVDSSHCAEQFKILYEHLNMDSFSLWKIQFLNAKQKCYSIDVILTFDSKTTNTVSSASKSFEKHFFAGAILKIILYHRLKHIVDNSIWLDV